MAEADAGTLLQGGYGAPRFPLQPTLPVRYGPALLMDPDAAAPPGRWSTRSRPIYSIRDVTYSSVWVKGQGRRRSAPEPVT